MSLLAYNKTTAPLALAAGTPTVTLPAASSAGARGAAVNVSAELKGLTDPNYAALQVQVAAAQVEYEWSTGIPEFYVGTLVVGQPAAEIAEDTVSYFADPTGLDTNPGTQAQPVRNYKTLTDKIPIFGRRGAVLFLNPGTYSYAEVSGLANMCRQGGSLSSPPAIVGSYAPIADYTVDVVNADGSFSVVETIPNLASGTGDSLSFASNLVTLTDAGAAFVTAGVKAGMFITIAGSATPANNGDFLITAVTSQTTLQFINPAGVGEVSYTGNWNVKIDQYFGIPRMEVISGGAAVGRAVGCAGNTNTTLVPHIPITNLAHGDVVRLQTPASIIDFTTLLAHAQTWAIGFKGIKFLRTANSLPVADGTNAFYEGCIIEITNGAGSVVVSRGSKFNSSNAGVWAGLGANNPFSALRPFGVFFDMFPTSSVASISLGDTSFFNGQHLFRNVDLLAARNSVVLLQSSHGRNTSIRADASSVACIAASGVTPTWRATWKGKFPALSAATAGVFNAWNGTNMTLDRLAVEQNIGVANVVAGLNANAAAGAAFGFQGARVSAGDVSGTLNNTGRGFNVTKGSRVLIDMAGVQTTTSGSVANFQFEAAADQQTYATVRTADGAGVKGYQDAYLNRAEPPV